MPTTSDQTIHNLMKKFVLPLVMLAALTSCNAKPELRKDIKEFIANFSLKASMDAYVTGGYTSTKVTTEGGTKTTVITSLEYSRVDEQHPTYVEVTTIYVNDEESSKTEIKFVEVDGEYYLSTNGELKPSSLNECKKLITKFFYKKTELDGTYHIQGYYYGDYLKEVAPVLQQYVTIDQENELYVHEYNVVQQNTEYYQKYTVNKLGMLVENHNTVENDSKKVEQDIYVHN